MRYIVINKQTNIVDNVIEWNGIAPIPHLDEFLLKQDDMGGPGWKWDGRMAIDPTPPVSPVKPGPGAKIKKL